MKQRLEHLQSIPWVAHLIRAWTRYGNRLGRQLAAAITYFSVLALVPILMFAFSLLGMTLTVIRPDWLGVVKDQVTEAFGSGKVTDLIDEYLQNWRAVGLVGLLSLLYAGSGWVGNLREAVKAQWRPEFEFDEHKQNPVVKVLLNALTLLVLLVGVGLTAAMSVIGTSLTNLVAQWLGLTGSTLGRLALRAGALTITVVCAWLLFLLIYWLLPRHPAPRTARVKGALAAAIALAGLQVGAGALMGVFSQNRAASLFGPVIVLMLVLNLFAQIALFVASWIATSNQPAVAYHWSRADEPLRDREDTETADGHWEQAEDDRQRLESEKAGQDATKAADRAARAGRPILPSTVGARRPLRVEAARAQVPWHPQAIHADGTHPEPDPSRSVPQDVAARSVKVSAIAGWATGAATGLGAGAVLTALLGRLVRR